MQHREEVLLELFSFLFNSGEHFVLIQIRELVKVVLEFFCDLFSQKPLGYLMDDIDLIGISLGGNCKNAILEVDLFECSCVLGSIDFGLLDLCGFCFSLSFAWFGPLEWDPHSHHGLDWESRRGGVSLGFWVFCVFWCWP